MKRVSFSVDDGRGREVEQYARDHGYASAGDFARVATLRIMSMYPSRKAGPANKPAEGGSVSPEVPLARQDETSETSEAVLEGAEP